MAGVPYSLHRQGHHGKTISSAPRAFPIAGSSSRHVSHASGHPAKSSPAAEAKGVPSVPRSKNKNGMSNSKLSVGVGRFTKSCVKLDEVKTTEDEFKLNLLQPSEKDYSYIEKVWNTKVYSRFIRNLEHVKEENGGVSNEKRLFHGSVNCMEIVKRGFDERHASIEGMFGAGIS
ncbi:hypothetical protein B566_EDAN009760 [Ephemera danica]|nr:hypothetical protein B566_EDAN009760 [Ephemera danica]